MNRDIILLDIGVLSTEESAALVQHEIFAYPFDLECVDVFNDILSITDAEIVLSSDWKLSYNNDLTVLDEIFRHNRVIKSPIFTTPNLGMRDIEITAFLHENSDWINRFLILDDLKLKIHPMNFVQCSAQYGIKEHGIR